MYHQTRFFSSMNGLENNPNSLSDNEDEGNGQENAQASTSEATPKAEKSKKQSKSNFFCQLFKYLFY